MAGVGMISKGEEATTCLNEIRAEQAEAECNTNRIISGAHDHRAPYTLCHVTCNISKMG